MFRLQRIHSLYLGLCLGLLAIAPPAYSGEYLRSCYANSYLGEPEHPQHRTLYLIVDQTTPLTTAMKTKLLELVSDWGTEGERVKIVRFSANVRGEYTELMFDEYADPPPTQEYLFHLRPTDKEKLLECLKTRDGALRQRLKHAASQTFSITNSKLPKTDLLYALREMTGKILSDDSSVEQIVLLVSDGLENSDYASFYQRKTMIKVLEAKKLVDEASKQGLIPDWKNAQVYMYGLGFVPDQRIYVRPKLLEPLKEFWQLYFAQGKAQLMQLGTPELLVMSVRLSPHKQRRDLQAPSLFKLPQ